MLKWLRRLEDLLFSPPHRFDTILAFVVVRLGLVFEGDDHRTDAEDPSMSRRESKSFGE
jgi:hypothetical protein